MKLGGLGQCPSVTLGSCFHCFYKFSVVFCFQQVLPVFGRINVALWQSVRTLCALFILARQ